MTRAADGRMTPVEALAEAEAAARDAGRLLAGSFGRRDLRVELKGRIDLVTEMDRRAEETIVRRLRAARPGAAILAEESGTIEGRGGASGGHGTWIVDPLDGTTNYAHGHPQWCVSIAYADGGRVLAGCVFDPLRDEMFAAAEGAGARLNGAPIRVSEIVAIEGSLLATGFPYDRRERADHYLSFYKAAMCAAQGVRRAGSAALDLAWTAAGRHDGFFEFKLKAWDIAAGELLVREAGGRVSDVSGGPLHLDGGETVATNGRLHDELLRLLRDAWPSS